jgi:hypothetical protein
MPRGLLHARDRADPHRPARPRTARRIARLVEGTAPATRGRAAVEGSHHAGRHGAGQGNAKRNPVDELELQEIGVGECLAGARADRSVAQHIDARASARRGIVGGDFPQIGPWKTEGIERRLGPVEETRSARRKLTPAHPPGGQPGANVSERAVERLRVTRFVDGPDEPRAQPMREAAHDSRGIGVANRTSSRRLDCAVHDRLARVQHEPGLQRKKPGEQHDRQRDQGLQRGQPATARAGASPRSCQGARHQGLTGCRRPPRPPNTSTGPRALDDGRDTPAAR